MAVKILSPNNKDLGAVTIEVTDIPYGIGTQTFICKSSRQDDVSRTKQQERIILATLQQKGYNLMSLTRNEAGKDGVKADVRYQLFGNELFSAPTSFDKAWERLTHKKLINYVN